MIKSSRSQRWKVETKNSDGGGFGMYYRCSFRDDSGVWNDSCAKFRSLRSVQELELLGWRHQKQISDTDSCRARFTNGIASFNNVDIISTLEIMAALEIMGMNKPPECSSRSDMIVALPQSSRPFSTDKDDNQILKV